MKFAAASSVLMLFGLVALTGCLPSEPDAATPTDALYSEATPGQLVEEFTEMALDPGLYQQDYRRYTVPDQLSTMGPKALTPLVEMVGSPGLSAESRLFALQGIVELMGPAYIPDIALLLDSDDSMVRACAVALLGPIRDPQVQDILRGALEDQEWRVRFSALSSLAVQGDSESRTKLAGMYFEPGLTEEDEAARAAKHEAVKSEVIRVLLREPVAGDLGILRDAVVQEFVTADLRAIIASTMGEVGDVGSVAALEKSLEMDNKPEYAELVGSAIDSIREREGETAAGR